MSDTHISGMAEPDSGGAVNNRNSTSADVERAPLGATLEPGIVDDKGETVTIQIMTSDPAELPEGTSRPVFESHDESRESIIPVGERVPVEIFPLDPLDPDDPAFSPMRPEDGEVTILPIFNEDGTVAVERLDAGDHRSDLPGGNLEDLDLSVIQLPTLIDPVTGELRPISEIETRLYSGDFEGLSFADLPGIVGFAMEAIEPGVVRVTNTEGGDVTVSVTALDGPSLIEVVDFDDLIARTAKGEIPLDASITLSLSDDGETVSFSVIDPREIDAEALTGAVSVFEFTLFAGGNDDATVNTLMDAFKTELSLGDNDGLGWLIDPSMTDLSGF